jgi:hypothetical protein
MGAHWHWQVLVLNVWFGFEQVVLTHAPLQHAWPVEQHWPLHT